MTAQFSKAELRSQVAQLHARIMQLEQERDAALTKWQTCRGLREVEQVESSRTAISLQAQLAAVTLDRDALSDELDSFKSENESFRAECVPLRNTVAELQGKLAAVAQQYTELVDRKITEDAEKAERFLAVTRERDHIAEELKKEKEFTIFDHQEDERCIAHWKAEAEEYRQSAISELGVSKKLSAQVAQLQAHNSKLETALFSLRNESSGFLGMADQSTHGITNMRCLQRRIEEADAALIQSTEEPQS